MKTFEISDDVRKALLPHHRAFQATVCQVANQLMGRPTDSLQAIYKYEGGVTVNRCEIVIFKDCVMDDFARLTSRSSPEEEATASAILQVAQSFTELGASALTASAQQIRYGNNLSSFFEPVCQ